MEEYSSEYSVAVFADHFVVGAQSSGTDILQNMFGLYVLYDQNLFDSNMTNMKLSTQAHNYFWRPLVGTSLTKTTAKDNVTKENVLSEESGPVFLVTRDQKDALVQTWQTYQPESTWEEFRDGPMGFSLLQEFMTEVSDMEFAEVFSYEELVESPQREFSRLVYCLLPRQDNVNHYYYGSVKREIKIDLIDSVVESSKLRELRDTQNGYLECVGVHKEFLTSSQAEEIDEFVASL